MKNMNENLDRASARLKEIRESSGLKQKQFAELFGVNHTTYNRYEKGGIEKMPHPLVEAISFKFSINPSWLLGFENVEKHMLSEKAHQKTKRIAVLGNIAAGIPILAQEELIDYEYIPETLKADFCLKVKGDSMINARIYDGDIVFIRQQTEVENGEIAVVRMDSEEVTLKRFYKYGNRIVLRAENPKYPEREFTAQDRRLIEVIGKCIAVKFSLEE